MTFKAPTTGSIATACAIAGLKTIFNENFKDIVVKTPESNLKINIDKKEKLSSNLAIATAHKNPYNDPDVTVGVTIKAQVELVDFEGVDVIVRGGEGVGVVTKPGLQIPIGGAAINPVPCKMIIDNLKPLLPFNKTAIVTISVPEGEKIAHKTLNPKLGIVGGISILGTTGIARSMSSQAYKDSIVKQLDVAVASNINNLIFVPGNIGEKLAIKCFNISPDRIIQTGNYVGYMFSQAKERDITQFTFFGHIGKLIKVAGGIFNTKHSIADGRREIMITHAVLCGADNKIASKLYNSKTTEEMLDILNRYNLSLKVSNSIADAIKTNCKSCFGINLNVILVDMEGNFLNNNFIEP